MARYSIGHGARELDEAIREKRIRLRHDIYDEVGPLCEAECGGGGGVAVRQWTSINEALVLRNDVPKKKQVAIMVRENCMALCERCHGDFHADRARRREITKRHLARMDSLGHDVDGFLAQHGMTRGSLQLEEYSL